MGTLHRPELDRSMAETLLGLRPGGLGDHHDLFLANLRLGGRSVFLMADLTPTLIDPGLWGRWNPIWLVTFLCRSRSDPGQ